MASALAVLADGIVDLVFGSSFTFGGVTFELVVSQP